MIVGAGKVGWNLARELLDKGHEVTVIENDRGRYLTVEQELEHNVQYGDASELWVLERAGVSRADLVIAVTGDDDLRALEVELVGYAADMGVAVPPAAEVPRAIAMPMRLRTDAGELALMTMIATFGTALDITLAELSLETFLPADAATASVLSRTWRRASGSGDEATTRPFWAGPAATGGVAPNCSGSSAAAAPSPGAPCGLSVISSGFSGGS